MNTEITRCDNCKRNIVVNSDALNHPFCINAFCDECIQENPTTKTSTEDVPHHVVGLIIKL